MSQKLSDVSELAVAPKGAGLTRHLLGLIDWRKPEMGTVMMLLVGGGVVGMAFLYVMTFLLKEGHAAFNTSSQVAWGLPIAFYAFLALTSSGLAVLASLDLIFGLKSFYPIAKRCVWLSIITLIAGFSVLALEVGHPFRMLAVLPFSFQVRSPMWWMGVFYSLDLVLLFVKFYLMHTGQWHTRFAHLIGVASFVTVIFASGTLGLVFGMMGMRAAWYSPMMPVFFMMTGFLSGIALMLLIANLTPGRARQPKDVLELYGVTLPRLFFIALLGVLAMATARVITGLWGNGDGLDAYWWMVRQPTFYVEMVVGLAVPLLLMSTAGLRASPATQSLAAVLALVGMFFSRLDLLLIGQVVPLFKGNWEGYQHYWPSSTEWALVPLGLGMVLTFYAVGNWLLRLADKETPAGGH